MTTPFCQISTQELKKSLEEELLKMEQMKKTSQYSEEKMKSLK